eukprot:GHVR01033390.1.p1 GENE.GHVR01033390.1~~GHVR01033390.1.p1  ORF type:complete len:230 (+),score=33.29 GHVR01033390.1:246-935(+)
MAAMKISELNNESVRDVRSLALEAQARRLEAQETNHDQVSADRLRRMGASAEAVAYGADKVSRVDSFSGHADRVIVESASIALMSRSAVDRGAMSEFKSTHYPLEAGEDSNPEARAKEARDFYSKMPAKDLVEASRAIQETIVSDIAQAPGAAKGTRITAAAIRRDIAASNEKELLTTQHYVNELAGWSSSSSPRLEKTHPLAVLSTATTEVMMERQAVKSKAKKAAEL